MTAVQEPSTEREIGRERRRKEDQRLITGRTRWTDNIALPGMLHLAMVRSPFAHARIVSIDASEAKNATNVVDVVTGADLGEAQGACINAWAITEDQVTPPHLPMPVDRVAFAGEVVAVVVVVVTGSAVVAGASVMAVGGAATRVDPQPTSSGTSTVASFSRLMAPRPSVGTRAC